MIDQTPGETYFAQVPDISARAAEVGSKFLSYSTGIEHTQVARNKSLPPEEWTGAAADAASEEIKTLGEKATELAQVFPKAKTELDEWPTAVSDARSTIDSIRQQWDSAISTYNSAIRNANKLAGNDPDKKILTDAAYQTAEAEQTRLKDEYTTCINNLDDSAQTVADKLLEVRRGYVSDQAVSRGRGAVAAEIFTYDTMPIVGGAANWQYAQEAAPALLRDLEAAADSEGPLSADLIQQLQDTWGDRLKNPFFVQAMADLYHAKHPGAGDFSDMFNRLALKTSVLEPYGKMDESEKALRNRWLQTLGTTMVLSTGGLNAGDYAGVEVSESFATVKNALVGRDGTTTIAQLETKNIDSFIATGNKDYSWHSNFAGGAHGTGFDITTQVMGFAAANNPNLAFGQAVYEGGDNSLASKLVQYDHDWPSTLGLRAAYTAPGQFPLAYDIPGYESAVQQSTDRLQALLSLSDTPDWIQQKGFPAKSHDPLMLAEQNRLEAVRDFMNKPTPFTVNGDWVYDEKHSKTDETIPMIRYLTGSRHPSGLGIDPKFVDEGEALGKMVEDLTQPLDEHTEALLGQDRAQAAGKAQAKVAGNFIAGYQDGLDQTSKLTDEGEDIYGRNNPKLRSHAGTVMANWIESFADQGDSPWDAQTAKESVTDGNQSVSTGRPRFVFSKNLRDAVLAPQGGILTDLAFDQSALDRVNERAYTLYKRDVALAMNDSHNGATSIQQSVDAVNRWGSILAHIEAAPAGMHGLEHEAVVRRNEAVRNAVDVLASVVPLDKIPGNKVSDALVSAAFDGAKDSLLESYLPTDFSSQDLQARLNASYATANSIQDSLVENFLSRSDWPNVEGKTKEELINAFFEQQGSGNTDPADGSPNDIVRDENGNLPPYTSLTEDQRRRLRGFLSTDTDLQAALDAAEGVSFSAYMDDGFKLHLKAK